MLLKVRDAEGNDQTIIVKGQDTPAVHDGVIANPAVAMDALAANVDRSGALIENPAGNADMFVNDQGDATADAATSFKVPAGGTWPPEGYPVGTGAISIIGTAGQKFKAREW